MLLAPAPHLPLHPAALDVEDRRSRDAERPALDHGEEAADEAEPEERPAEREERDADGPAPFAGEAPRMLLRQASLTGKTPRCASFTMRLVSFGNSRARIHSRYAGFAVATSDSRRPRN